MKAHLLYRDRDFDLGRALPGQSEELMADLELTTLFDAMSLGDDYLFEISKRVVLTSLDDPAAIVYRQHILGDCILQAGIIREMYSIAVEAIQGEKKIWGFSRQSPSGILRRAVEVLQLFVGLLRRLRQIVDDHADEFSSDGMTTLFTMVSRELDDGYFQTIDEHLKRLRFRDGILISAGLGKGNQGVRYVLRSPGAAKQGWMERIGIGPRSAYSFEIAPRDEAGARALSELTDRGTNLVANALAESTDHILSFFTMLCSELGFYVSCLNLHERIAGKSEPLCIPLPLPSDPPALSCSGLYDICLALRVEGPLVGNDADADGRSLVMITGANSGGKSTFLRSIGLAQLMMQCGMYVAAESFHANVCDGLFTHFIREEDASMTSGRLDEELSRMSVIAGTITSRSVMLFNESFAATNEREGSEIARQIVRALLDAGIKVFFVTHLFDLAESFYEQGLPTALFLRAERLADGRRSFKLTEGKPLATSFGVDLYNRLGWPASAGSACVGGVPAIEHP